MIDRRCRKPWGQHQNPTRSRSQGLWLLRGPVCSPELQNVCIEPVLLNVLTSRVTRRPASNADPYRITGIIMETYVETLLSLLISLVILIVLQLLRCCGVRNTIRGRLLSATRFQWLVFNRANRSLFGLNLNFCFANYIVSPVSVVLICSVLQTLVPLQGRPFATSDFRLTSPKLCASQMKALRQTYYLSE